MPDNVTLEHLRQLLDAKLDAQAEVSKAHWDALRREVSTGFAGVNGRLDIVNGRLNKHGDRISAIERHPRLQPRSSDDAARVVPSEDRSITRRDVTVGVACSGAAAWLVIWILQLLGKL